MDPQLSESLDGQAASSSITTTSSERTQTGSAGSACHAQHGGVNEDDDEWTEADIVASFSPVDSHVGISSSLVEPTGSARASSAAPTADRPAGGRKVSGRGASSEWADWNTFLAAHTLPMQPPRSCDSGCSSGSKPSNAAGVNTWNAADDAFFDAFEVATNSNRAPSPPIIDLRGVEKQLEQKKEQQKQKQHQNQNQNQNQNQIEPLSHSTDDDFFSRFQRAPQTALGRSSPLVLEPEQLESIHHARTSHMDTASAQPQNIGIGNSNSGSGSGAHARADTGRGSISSASASASAAASSWTGSLKKTWTTLRGIQSEIASHLPSTSDFIVPEPEAGVAGGAVNTNQGGGLLIASDATERVQAQGTEGGDRATWRSGEAEGQRATGAHASEHAHTTRHGSSRASTGVLSGAPLRARDLMASWSTGALESNARGASAATLAAQRGGMHSSIISGAPGFDTSSTRQWNTGHWTLDDERKRVIPVTLSKRDQETEMVIEQFHASRIQAQLPARLQLGKRWELLYSMDQHGISLQTLYHRVAVGMDPSRARESSGDAPEAWMRGATSTARHALGVRVPKLGGALNSVSDAGLVLAIKDEQDNVFGAFLNEKLRPQQHYYGSGECFLWKTSVHSHQKLVHVFKWTAKNDYIVLSESDFLSVGGGDGKFGLWIDATLQNGISDPCPAFDNPILSSTSPTSDSTSDHHFSCYGLEVWAVGID